MELGTAVCTACPHPAAAHRALGACRLNGCSCEAFASPYRGRDDSAERVASAPTVPVVVDDAHALAAARTLFALCAGVLVGILIRAALA